MAVRTHTADVGILSLSARELVKRLASGALTATEVANAYLAQIEAREPDVQAWAWLDSEYVLQQAGELDNYKRSGRPIGPLHGLPVGLKDIIDTARLPTQNGTVIDEGRTPTADAYVVTRLKQAGALILGKTVTTELAFMAPGKTRNPHNVEHTPGGSSSGSAAAVAAAMVPVAIGTQTGGSVIRPAAFCGVTGFKPTFGAIPRTGVLSQSPSLDTIGVFARTPEDAALLAEHLFGYDKSDPATHISPPPRLLDTAQSKPPLTPIFALVKPPGWDSADPQTHAAFEELAQALGEQCFEVPLPAHFDDAAELRKRINFAEMSRHYYHYAKHGGGKLADVTRDAIREGSQVLAKDYLAALDWQKVLTAGLEEIFEHADAILAPSALGPAPKSLEDTGDPIFNGLWTFCGSPAITLPALTAENGLPMGVQLIGPRENDGRLLRTANWLNSWFDALDGAKGD